MKAFRENIKKNKIRGRIREFIKRKTKGNYMMTDLVVGCLDDIYR